MFVRFRRGPPDDRRDDVATALMQLEAEDRDVLDLSVRRRLTDEQVARHYRCPVREVAGRRVAAIDRLGRCLGVDGGDELGHVLKALVDQRTWAPLDAAGQFGTGPALPAAARALGAGQSHDSRLLPVIEVPRGWRDVPRREPRVAARRGGTVVIAAAALAATAGVVAAWASRGGEGAREGRAVPREAARFVPAQGAPLAMAFASDPGSAARYPTARLRRPTVLYDAPRGRPKLTLSARTEWGSPRVLSVVRQQGGWLGVQAPELRNHELAWLPAERASIGSVAYSVHADLSRRQLTVLRSGVAVRRVRMAAGDARTPAPTGRFAVTDALRVRQDRSPLGCCVLALTGHRTRLPANWSGGDRLAIYASRDRDARWLVGTVPLGAPVFIRR